MMIKTGETQYSDPDSAEMVDDAITHSAKLLWRMAVLGLEKSGDYKDTPPPSADDVVIMPVLVDEEADGAPNLESVKIECTVPASDYKSTREAVILLEGDNLEYPKIFVGGENEGDNFLTPTQAGNAMAQIRRKFDITPEQFDSYNPFDNRG